MFLHEQFFILNAFKVEVLANSFASSKDVQLPHFNRNKISVFGLIWIDLKYMKTFIA